MEVVKLIMGFPSLYLASSSFLLISTGVKDFTLSVVFSGIIIQMFWFYFVHVWFTLNGPNKNDFFFLKCMYKPKHSCNRSTVN